MTDGAEGGFVTNFEIHFQGLICFYSPVPRDGDPAAPKTMALIVRDSDHDRQLVTAERVMTFSTISMQLSFNDPDAKHGVITGDADFLSSVPHLGDDNITRGGTFVDPSLAIQLVFPPFPGTLKPAIYFPKRGNYQLAQRNTVRDVAQWTVLQMAGDYLHFACDGVPIDIDPRQPWAYVQNDASIPGRSTANDICGNHFRRYAFIMRAPSNAAANCAAVADVVDDETPSPPVRNGVYTNVVAALNVKRVIPPVVIPDQPSHRPLREGDDPAAGLADRPELQSAARHSHPGEQVALQTQCSNSNWP